MNRKMVVLFCLAAITLTSCKPVSSSEKNVSMDKSTEKEDTQNFEDVYSTISEEDPHITIDLYENVHMDADVTPYEKYSAGLGLYDYTQNSQEGERNLVEDIPSMLDRLNGYYGAEILKENNIRGNAAYFEFSAKGFPVPYMDADSVYYKLPESRMEDTSQLQGKVREVLDILEGAADFMVCTKYECAYISEAVYRQSEELHSKLGAHVDLSSCNNEKFYFVTVRAGIDDIGIIFSGLNFPLEAGKKISDNVVVEADSICAYTECGYKFVFDENMKLLYGSIMQMISYQADKVSETEILSSKDMVKILYEHYQNSAKEVNITDMQLYYTALPTDDNETVKFQLAPVWLVQTYTEGEGWYSKEYYNAVTGEYLS